MHTCVGCVLCGGVRGRVCVGVVHAVCVWCVCVCMCVHAVSVRVCVGKGRVVFACRVQAMCVGGV